MGRHFKIIKTKPKKATSPAPAAVTHVYLKTIDTEPSQSTFTLTKSTGATDGHYTSGSSGGGIGTGDAQLDSATWADLQTFVTTYLGPGTGSVVFEMTWQRMTSINSVRIEP